MSAPKRTNTPLIPAASDGRREWRAAFHKNVRQDGTARRAWELLKNIGLETKAQRALWTFAYPLADYVKRERRKIRRINSEVKALVRAAKIEKERHRAGDPRAALFSDRHHQKYDDVLRSEMPFADDGVTVGDWMLSRVSAGKGMPDLPASRKAFASQGPRSPISDRKFYLFVLLCYVENAGVRLGLERLAALARCADPDCELDPRTCARFLASLPATFRAKCRRDFCNLPAPSLLPPQN